MASFNVSILFETPPIFLITAPRLTHDYQYPQLYFYVLITYVIMSCIQGVALKKINLNIPQQLIGLFAVDVLALSLLTLAVDGPNLQLSLLFVIIIFAASLLLDAHKALLITLIAVISVIYQLFLGNLLAFSSLNDLSSMKYFSFLASFGKLAYLDLSNKPL